MLTVLSVGLVAESLQMNVIEKSLSTRVFVRYSLMKHETSPHTNIRVPLQHQRGVLHSYTITSKYVTYTYKLKASALLQRNFIAGKTTEQLKERKNYPCVFSHQMINQFFDKLQYFYGQ